MLSLVERYGCHGPGSCVGMFLSSGAVKVGVLVPKLPQSASELLLVAVVWCTRASVSARVLQNKP